MHQHHYQSSPWPRMGGTYITGVASRTLRGYQPPRRSTPAPPSLRQRATAAQGIRGEGRRTNGLIISMPGSVGLVHTKINIQRLQLRAVIERITWKQTQAAQQTVYTTSTHHAERRIYLRRTYTNTPNTQGLPSTLTKAHVHAQPHMQTHKQTYKHTKTKRKRQMKSTNVNYIMLDCSRNGQGTLLGRRGRAPITESPFGVHAA